MYWWWDYVEDNNLYRYYPPLAKFVSGVDWPAWRLDTHSPGPSHLPVSVNVYGVSGGDRALLWIHDPLAFRIIDGKPRAESPSPK